MINKILGTLAVSLLFAVQANAATMIITGPTDVTVGDTFTLEIYGDFGETGLGAGGINFGYDNSLVQITDAVLNMDASDVSFSCPGNPACEAANTDNTYVVAFGSFGLPLIAADAGSTLMATLTFTALDTASEGGLAVFTMVDNPAFAGGWFAPAFAAPIAPPTFENFSLNINSAVVPLPAAVWFMIGGLGTLLGFRRK